MPFWVMVLARVYRQGDVIFKEIDEVPSWADKTGDRLVIESESGNSHVLEALVFDDGRYVEVDKPSVVKHPQHRQLTLPVGKYMVYRVRDYFRDEIGD